VRDRTLGITIGWMSPTERPSKINRGVTTELRRAGWLSAAALSTIALTVFGFALSADRANPRVPWIATIAVCAEVLVALVATAWLSRQVVRNAGALESSVAEVEQARADADAEAKHKARLIALLDAALGCSPVGFAFFDRDLRFLRVNSALAKVNGLEPEDHVGLTLRDIHPWLARDVEPVLRQVVSSRKPAVNLEFQGPAPGSRGQSRSWLTSCFPIITANGELFGAGMAVSDVTEIKRLEEQFLQAQKMEAVGRLAGGVAHDFNNLLTVISSYAELIMFDPAMQKGRGEIEEIRGATARAAKLTRQLLAFSRRQALEPRIVNPNDVLRGVEALIRGLIVGEVEIGTSLATDTPLIRVDPGQLEQVVMNLTINAADAMPNGGRLDVTTRLFVLDDSEADNVPDLPFGRYAMIRVSDTGHGMSPDTVAQIFEPFFTTKEPGRGTGLGLSTVFGIVKQSGGDIKVDSTVGKGSAFTVYFPAVDRSEP
jgi:two-component system, cell cycle sensor histidine kinase and response regulator CckA